MHARAHACTHTRSCFLSVTAETTSHRGRLAAEAEGQSSHVRDGGAVVGSRLRFSTRTRCPFRRPPRQPSCPRGDGRARSVFGLTASAEWGEEGTVWAGPRGEGTGFPGNKRTGRSFIFYGFIPRAITGDKGSPGRAAGRDPQSLKQIPAGQRGVRAAAGGRGRARSHAGNAGARGASVFSLSLLSFEDCNRHLHLQHRSEVRRPWLGSRRLTSV